jgi:hypothetical protein
MECILLTPDKYRCRNLVKMLMNLTQNSRRFLTNLRTISFSRKALFTGITKDGASRLLVKIRFRILYCGTKIATLRLPIFYSDVPTSTNMRLTPWLLKTSESSLNAHLS